MADHALAQGHARVAGAWLRGFAADFNTIYLSKWVPEPEKLFDSPWTSTVLTIAVANAVLLVLFPKGRRLLFNIAETVLACALVFCIVCIVVGLPIGAVYLTACALGYVWSAIAALEPVARVLGGSAAVR